MPLTIEEVTRSAALIHGRIENRINSIGSLYNCRHFPGAQDSYPA
jgi:hypothetical protein